MLNISGVVNLIEIQSNNLTLCDGNRIRSTVLLGKLVVLSASQEISPLFMEPEISLSFSQDPDINLYREPDESNVRTATLFP
jgi:hypothetical protein